MTTPSAEDARPANAGRASAPDSEQDPRLKRLSPGHEHALDAPDTRR